MDKLKKENEIQETLETSNIPETLDNKVKEIDVDNKYVSDEDVDAE